MSFTAKNLPVYFVIANDAKLIGMASDDEKKTICQVSSVRIDSENIITLTQSLFLSLSFFLSVVFPIPKK